MTAGSRRFVLNRLEDVTGVSGTGVVAEGVTFTDGTTVIRWAGPTPSTVVWATVGDAVAVHGHGGKTELVWVDDTNQYHPLRPREGD